MRIDRLHPARLGAERLDVAVVIDVLRATSTAIALLDSGIPRLLVLRDPSELERLPPASKYVVFSELELPDCSHEHVDNSPVLASRIDVAGGIPVLLTTNGTKAIRAALGCARLVILASFPNLQAAADVALEHASDRITLLPAGHFDRVETRIEDETCADALAQRLRGEVCDIRAATATCLKNDRIQRRLRKPGFREDFDYCFTANRSPIVPSVRLIKSVVHDVISVRPLLRERT